MKDIKIYCKCKHCTFIPRKRYCSPLGSSKLHFIGWRLGHVNNRFREGAKTVNFFRGRKLKVYFCVNYLSSNELIGYVDLSDFHETWPKCSSDISVPKGVRLL